MTKTSKKYSPEVRERAAQMVLSGISEHGSRWAAIVAIAGKIGCAPQTLNEWVLSFRQYGPKHKIHDSPDVFARKIVGWRTSRTANTSFVLDALEQALYDRKPVSDGGLIHHSDRGSQYLSIKYTERLAEAGLEPSVGSVGDSYDNALAETINGLYKAEVIHRCGPWRSCGAVEYATLEWVDWFNNRRLLDPIGNIPPAEAEENYYAALTNRNIAA